GNSPSNAHAYRLYLFKDANLNYFRFLASPRSAKPCIVAQLLSCISEIFQKFRQQHLLAKTCIVHRFRLSAQIAAKIFSELGSKTTVPEARRRTIALLDPGFGKDLFNPDHPDGQDCGSAGRCRLG
ncbi:UNVERIFIED_ORG: hypothetical protein HNP28_002978, partial [Comamonas terrigena]